MRRLFNSLVVGIASTLVAGCMDIDTTMSADGLDGRNRNDSTVKTLRPDTIWKATIGYTASPITLTRQHVLVGTNAMFHVADKSLKGMEGVICCFERSTGTLQWCHAHAPTTRTGLHVPFNGIRSRPAIDGDRVYYVSNNAELMCLDIHGFHDGENDGPFTAETSHNNIGGDVVWKLDMPKQLGVSAKGAGAVGNPVCGPLVLENRVFCLTGNGCNFWRADKGFLTTPDAPAFIAVDKQSGRVLWQSALPGKNTVYQWSSPVALEIDGQTQVVFPGGDGVLYGFEPATGELLWKFDCNPPNATQWTMAKQGSRAFFFATPTVAGNEIFVGLNHSLEGPIFEDRPLIALRIIHVEGKYRPVVLWTFQDTTHYCNGTYSSAAVGPAVVFSLSEWFSSLVALDRNNGRLLWQLDVDDTSVSHGYPSAVIHGDLVFVPAAQDLFVVRAQADKQVIGKIHFDRYIGSSPLIDDGTLFIASGNHLHAIDLKSLKE